MLELPVADDRLPAASRLALVRYAIVAVTFGINIS
jgi:hypothetical protein